MRNGVVTLWALGLFAGAGLAAAQDDHGPAPTPFGAEAAQTDSIKYRARVTDNSRMGVTVTNYGFIGNNFVARTPSMEYPLGTGYEHLVRGGLWVGACARDEASDAAGDSCFIGVVTGAVDELQGGSAQLATEFTPAGPEIKARSTLPNSKFYHRPAVSELDYIGEFSDRPSKRATGTGENHRPISILVRQENYAWSFSDYQHLVIFHFVIRNIGLPLRNAWVGLFAELASGPKNSYSTWPPTSGGGGSIGGWYGKKWIQYDDSLRFFREHYCLSGPVVPAPNNCILDRVPEWVGIKLLGCGPEPISTKKVTLAAWHFEPGGSLRDEDTERYAIMSAGPPPQDLTAFDLQPGPGGDPVELLTVGPFAQIDPGDSISVDFALVGGDGLADASQAQKHARKAQRAYDLNYIIEVPPDPPLLKVVARDRALDLYWDRGPEDSVDPTGSLPHDFEGYRIYAGEDRNHLLRIAQFDSAGVGTPNDTTGFNTGFAAVRHETMIDHVQYHYRYTINGLRNGFKYFTAVTAYDLGTSETESLESGIPQNKTLAIPGPAPGEKASGKVFVFPNPYRVEARWDRGRQVRDHYLWFANLPERCTLRIYTLSGDLVFETPFVGAEYHGVGARGVFDPVSEFDIDPPTLSGTTFAWNLITAQGQAAATGLYMYSVEDAHTHGKTVGKFLIVKSDREGF